MAFTRSPQQGEARRWKGRRCREDSRSTTRAIATLAAVLALSTALPSARCHPSSSPGWAHRRDGTSDSAASTAALATRCDCGFVDLTEGADPTQVWTSLWKADFLTMTTDDLTNGFRFMQNEIQRATANLSRDFEPGNVNLATDGLRLTVLPVNGNNQVPSAGIYSKDSELHFGNYYAEIKVPSAAGTVSAFYVYKSDFNEVDMEYTNANGIPNAPIKNTVKPQIFNGTMPLPSTYTRTFPPTGVSLSDDFHTWSFQWSPTQVVYGLDGNMSSVITVNVPQQPGVLSFSHWSDGNPNYSGGPPSAPSVLTFRRAWAFWNNPSLAAAPLPCKLSSAPCRVDARAATGSTADAISSAPPAWAATRSGWAMRVPPLAVLLVASGALALL